jgi:hypothetical protein
LRFIRLRNEEDYFIIIVSDGGYVIHAEVYPDRLHLL